MLRLRVLISLFGLQILKHEGSHESVGHFHQSYSQDRDRLASHSPRIYHRCNPGSVVQSADDLHHQAADSSAFVSRQILDHRNDEGHGDSSRFQSSCSPHPSNSNPIYIHKALILTRWQPSQENLELYLSMPTRDEMIKYSLICQLSLYSHLWPRRCHQLRLL